jgi:hypothetical protein
MNSPSHFVHVSPAKYATAFLAARGLSETIANATSNPADVIAREGDAYLSRDGRSGFYVAADGELCGMFSLVKGRGDAIVSNALFVGADHLDCFDGYLPTLYARHGFEAVKRAPNWTAGGPDVVYMVASEAAAPVELF